MFSSQDVEDAWSGLLAVRGPVPPGASCLICVVPRRVQLHTQPSPVSSLCSGALLLPLPTLCTPNHRYVWAGSQRLQQDPGASVKTCWPPPQTMGVTPQGTEVATMVSAQPQPQLLKGQQAGARPCQTVVTEPCQPRPLPLVLPTQLLPESCADPAVSRYLEYFS